MEKPANTWNVRKRQFFDLLPPNVKSSSPYGKLLDISISFWDEELANKVKEYGYIYQPADLEPTDERIDKQDIMHTTYADCTFDVVMSSHTLEHLADYHSAMVELARIVKPDGYIYIRIPVNHEKYNQRIYIGHPRKGWEHTYNPSIYQMDYDIKNILEVIDYKEYPNTHEAAWLCKPKTIEHYLNYN